MFNHIGVSLSFVRTAQCFPGCNYHWEQNIRALAKLNLGAAGKVFFDRFVLATSEERLPEKQNQPVSVTFQFLSVNFCLI